jgi:hypothetical protein
MESLSKTWQEFRDILDNNNLYFDYDEDSIHIKLFCQRNSMISYDCVIKKEEPTNADETEFRNNYQYKAGEKTYLFNSWNFTATKNTSTELKVYLTDPEEDLVDSFLYKGSLHTDSNAVFGDLIEIDAVIDIPNPENEEETIPFLIQKIVRRYTNDGTNVINLIPGSYDYTSYKKKVPEGVYLRVTYTSTGTENDVKVIVNADYEYDREPE